MRAGEFTNPTANAKTVLRYVKSIHNDFHLDHEILQYPNWTLTNMPLTALHIPDPDSDIDPQDPYDRVQYIDMYHVDEIKARDIERKPIVVDSDGHILDGNHRAVAARLMGIKTIPAWIPANKDKKLDELKCWPGYKRVKGKPAGSPGSCRKG